MKTAAIIQRELRRIAKENGGILKPEAVVDAARPEDSPLHGRFCWADDEAARLYRIFQARQLIRVSVQVVTGKGEKEYVVRAFVSLSPDREEDGGGYRLITTVMGDADMRAQMLSDALSEMELFAEKYGTLTELAEVFVVAASVRKRLGK